MPQPGDEMCLITSRDLSHLLLFITVPDSKQEVERLLALGATQVADYRRPDDGGWVTLADPEGNEFCILPKEPTGTSPIS